VPGLFLPPARCDILFWSNPMSPNDLPIPIRTTAEPSIRWLADVVCYFCGTLESDSVIIQLAPGHAALDPTHSVSAGRR
jgi:hypothetical protein